MFWTNWVRGLTKVFLGAGVVASLLGAGATVQIFGRSLQGFSVIIAFVVFLVGIVVSISSVALIMMLTEISVSAHEINKKLNSSSNPDLSNSMTSPHVNSGERWNLFEILREVWHYIR